MSSVPCCCGPVGGNPAADSPAAAAFGMLGAPPALAVVLPPGGVWVQVPWIGLGPGVGIDRAPPVLELRPGTAGVWDLGFGMALNFNAGIQLPVVAIEAMLSINGDPTTGTPVTRAFDWHDYIFDPGNPVMFGLQSPPQVYFELADGDSIGTYIRRTGGGAPLPVDIVAGSMGAIRVADASEPPP